jgi:hypothetical protein
MGVGCARHSRAQLPHSLAIHALKRIGLPDARSHGRPLTDSQFKAQEPGTDDEVLQFCQVNYGVTFPIAKKVHRALGVERWR